MAKSLGKKQLLKRILLLVWIAFICFACVYPMKLAPMWNGEIPDHRNQYELMAESLLHGHLYLEKEVTPQLLALDNPYDYDARVAAGLSEGTDFQWDHALYKGHYYMYFGVVPTILLFLPYRAITGTSLTTYHATQIFTIFIIIGFFALFGFLRKRFAPSMHAAIYVVLTTALSVASVWYFIPTPALYCTAISSGVCMMTWAIYFYIRAVFDEFTLNKRIGFAVVGALFGALAFGCRPPVALANIVAIPLFIVFLKTNKIQKADIKKIVLIALPYVVIGVLLMLYNYARFDNPFEFGQKYQLTNTDQSAYHFPKGLGPMRWFNGMYQMFFETKPLAREFPYVNYAGMLYEFPLFFAGIGAFCLRKSMRVKARTAKLLGFLVTILITLGAIVMFQVSMSPGLMERYQSDAYYLVAIFSFIIFAFMNNEAEGKARRWFYVGTVILALITIAVAFLLFFVPQDCNLMEWYPEKLQAIRMFMGRFDFLIW